MTFLGLMHGERIGFGMTPVVALSYVAVAGVLFGAAELCHIIPQPAKEPEGHSTSLPEPSV